MFTDHELGYMRDTDFLLTKATVAEKVTTLLEQTHHRLRTHVVQETYTFPPEVSVRSGKISRGENYRQLPYWVLDYPRHFTNGDVFALRTMFWWGHFFSVTFQLGGVSWEQYRPLVLSHRDQLRGSGVSICISDDPWQHHRDPDYYRPVQNLSDDSLCQTLSEQEFLKLAIFLPVDRGTELPQYALTFFKQMLRLIGWKTQHDPFSGVKQRN